MSRSVLQGSSRPSGVWALVGLVLACAAQARAQEPRSVALGLSEPRVLEAGEEQVVVVGKGRREALCAIDPRSGQVRWRAELGAAVGVEATTREARLEGLLLRWRSGWPSAYAVELATGTCRELALGGAPQDVQLGRWGALACVGRRLRWVAPDGAVRYDGTPVGQEAVIAAAPLDEGVVVATDGAVVRLDPAGGALWTVERPGTDRRAALFAGGGVVALSSGDTVVTLDPATGAVLRRGEVRERGVTWRLDGPGALCVDRRGRGTLLVQGQRSTGDERGGSYGEGTVVLALDDLDVVARYPRMAVARVGEDEVVLVGGATFDDPRDHVLGIDPARGRVRWQYREDVAPGQLPTGYTLSGNFDSPRPPFGAELVDQRRGRRALFLRVSDEVVGTMGRDARNAGSFEGAVGAIDIDLGQFGQGGAWIRVRQELQLGQVKGPQLELTVPAGTRVVDAAFTGQGVIVLTRDGQALLWGGGRAGSGRVESRR